MSRSTISTFQFFAMFPDAEAARLYLESRLWPDGVRCPFCASGHITARQQTSKGKITPGFYRCNACDFGENFTVRTNTIMERSKIPLHKWLYSMYLLVTARKGISSLQLAKEIGITQKSAWFVLQRLREAMKKPPEELNKVVDALLSYRPKPKSKAGKRRERKKKRDSKNQEK